MISNLVADIHICCVYRIKIYDERNVLFCDKNFVTESNKEFCYRIK
jgi:hypothetical protein